MSRKRKTPEAPRPPKVPGVRHVKTTVYDVEARTFEGETSYRQVPRTVWVPAPPRDWDAVVARALVCAAILGTVLSLGWSTDSIGHLLDRTGSDVTAYAVAVVFDVVWLACQAREWLEREYPERAAGAKVGGYVCLALAMAAIFANGYEAGETVAGAGGAAVSALAKFLWVLALGYYAVELDEGAAYDLHTRRQSIAVRLALRASRRRLDAAEAYERHVYGDQGGVDVQVTRYEAPETAPAAVPAPVSPPVPAVSPAPAPASLSTPPPAPPAPAPAATVPPVSPQAPAASTVPVPPAPADARERVLTSLGLPLDHPGGVPAPDQAPAEPVKEPEPAPRPVLKVVGGKTDFIRAAIAADPRITLDDLTDQVRAAFGDKPNLRKDVRRLRARIEGKAS
ncbi:hypothetical protein [Streptomyces sp. CCM_MD2014]|uniref:hypothetical protein n=1 Tax=Streptomyces sp. CCM_MD2014 TaxID=1561022 RepID=UPI0007765FA1|nr:hypothetical protein [Streptomyces sp. CCM_MD2014]